MLPWSYHAACAEANARVNCGAEVVSQRDVFPPCRK